MSSRSMFRTRRWRPAGAALLAAGLTAAVLAPSAVAYPARVVQEGETLSSIAAANGLQIARLAAANGLNWDAGVVAGQTLQIPPVDGAYTSPTGETRGYSTSTTPLAGSKRAAQAASSPGAVSGASSGSGSTSGSAGSASSGSGSASGGSGHHVAPGDTLSAIAARLGVSVQALAAANGIADPNLVVSGSRLRAPGSGTTPAPAPSSVPTSSSSSSSGTMSASTGPEGGPAATGAGAGNSAEKLSSGQISSIAAQHGVPGDLAAAIAWQESGNNNAMVSSTGARGVMQIMPGTWDWINGTLAQGGLQQGSASENVRAGSLLLRSLLRETGGDEATALAGYYQGLNSVRSRGMYDDTKQYVDNVLALRGRVGG